MIPIETLNTTSTFAPHVSTGPSWALMITEYLGLQMISIDGNILPGSALLLMFAAWGIWYWVLMINGAIKQVPILIKKLWEKEDES